MSRPSPIAVSLSLFLLALAVVVLPLAIAQFGGESSQAANLVVLIQGHAAIKRKNWTGFAPLTFGVNLQTGDLLRMDESSVAKVVCSDLKLRDIGAGTIGTPCTPSQEILRRPDGSLVRPTRTAPSEGSFPIVLSPRRTKLLSERPLLRWTEVKDASTYHLIVRGPELKWTAMVHSKTELQYPDNAPKFEAGQSYKLIVAISDEQNSGNESANGLGFSVLSSKERKVVLGEQKQLESLGLEEGPTQYLIGHLYASHGLNAEAIQRLEAVSKKFMVPATERLLGELYLSVELPRQAEAHYLKSLELSKKEQDDEGQMQSQLALARIYSKVLGNNRAAGEQLEAAIAIAGKVGDDVTIFEARKQLSELNRTGT
jgi:hypothetical protein